MISIGRLRSELQSLDDGSLRAARAQVIGQWESLAGGRWSAITDFVQVLEPFHDRIRSLDLTLAPVSSVAEVKVRDETSTDDWADLTALDAADYRLRGERTLFRRAGFWEDEVRVKYTGGYADEATDPKTPGDIAEALVVQARFNMDRHDKANLITSQRSFKDFSDSFLAANFHPLFRETAKRHRRHS